MSQISSFWGKAIHYPTYPIVWGKNSISYGWLSLSLKAKQTSNKTMKAANSTWELTCKTKTQTIKISTMPFVFSYNQFCEKHRRTIKGYKIIFNRFKNALWPPLKPLVCFEPDSCYRYLVYEIAEKEVYSRFHPILQNFLIKSVVRAVVAFAVAFFGSPYFLLFHAIGITKEIYFSISSVAFGNDNSCLSTHDRMIKAMQHICFFVLDLSLCFKPIIIGAISLLPIDILGGILNVVCNSIKNLQLTLGNFSLVELELRQENAELKQENRKLHTEISGLKGKLDEISNNLDSLPQKTISTFASALDNSNFIGGFAKLVARETKQTLGLPGIDDNGSYLQLPPAAKIDFLGKHDLPTGSVLYIPPEHSDHPLAQCLSPLPASRPIAQIEGSPNSRSLIPLADAVV